jgi:hypothetical protein
MRTPYSTVMCVYVRVKLYSWGSWVILGPRKQQGNALQPIHQLTRCPQSPATDCSSTVPPPPHPPPNLLLPNQGLCTSTSAACTQLAFSQHVLLPPCRPTFLLSTPFTPSPPPPHLPPPPPPGFGYEYQFMDVGDYQGRGESEPHPYYYQNLGEAEAVVATYMFMRLLGYPADKVGGCGGWGVGVGVGVYGDGWGGRGGERPPPLCSLFFLAPSCHITTPRMHVSHPAYPRMQRATPFSLALSLHWRHHTHPPTHTPVPPSLLPRPPGVHPDHLQRPEGPAAGRHRAALRTAPAVWAARQGVCGPGRC